ncbi:Cytidylate kinase [Porphyromonas levii]|uniref:cytidylate kinase-like family protein n=1 Tax=Porphyromonas levii TaxID=28114 RepID=UPI001B8D47A0|nr:cytidylate kinase-like family protein [Porphyromonas levii]MBR8731649.1 Cytidylate kinase [Porphyromonas levii]
MENEMIYPDNTFAICIGRSFGSGGYKVACKLQRRLKVMLYDKEILDKAAEDNNIRKELFEKADEKNVYELPLVVGSTLCMPNPFYMYTNNYLSNDHLFTLQAETIQKLAAKGSAIFVGRCADYVLREHPHLLTVYIADDIELRAKHIQERLGMETIDDATAEVEKVDKDRREYYNYYTSRNWGRADNYDLSIKLSSVGIDYAVDMIVGLMRRRGFPME